MEGWTISHIGETFGASQDVSVHATSNDPPALQESSEYANIIHNRRNVEYADWSSFEAGSYYPSRPRRLLRRQGIGIATAEQSDADGILPKVMSFTANFSKPYSFNGIGFSFRNVPTGMKVTFYNGSNVKYQEEISADNTLTEIELTGPYEAIDKIVVEVSIIADGSRFLVLHSMRLGATDVFTEADITKADLLREVDVSSRSWPISTLSFTVYGARDLFQEHQPIIVAKDGRQMQTLYASKLVKLLPGDTTAEVQCQSAGWKLDKIRYYGGIWTALTPITTILNDIFYGTGLSYELEEGFALSVLGEETAYVRGWIPICTKREACIYCANAIGATIDDSSGVVVFRAVPPSPLRQAPIFYDARNILIGSNSQAENNTPCRRVEWTVHNYVKSSDTTEAYNWYLSTSENTLIEFSEPLHNLQAYALTLNEDGYEVSRALTDAVQFVEYGANYCLVSSSTTQRVAIVGKQYVDSKVVHVAQSNDVVAGYSYRTETIDSATLSIVDGGIRAQALLTYYGEQNSYNFRAIDQYSAVCGSRCSILGSIGYITKIQTDFSGIIDVEARRYVD